MAGNSHAAWATHVHHLRRLLTGLGAPSAEPVRSEPSGYVRDVEPERSVLPVAGRHTDAAAAARSGLALWRGSAPAGMPLGRRLEGHRLDKLHRQTVRAWIEAEPRWAATPSCFPLSGNSWRKTRSTRGGTPA
ncbi:BTAD domain-containing putative transcriptional regulator [Amycolatopsis sp. NPDC023774]|uniref:BTAD domain-containing putative transcriptional regulator n=1 Tax=Amycolatopsis sp. NPDC023774 TaxID=3155015 RepID=UPI0033D9F278